MKLKLDKVTMNLEGFRHALLGLATAWDHEAEESPVHEESMTLEECAEHLRMLVNNIEVEDAPKPGLFPYVGLATGNNPEDRSYAVPESWREADAMFRAMHAELGASRFAVDAELDVDEWVEWCMR